jgi:hypothetical protein
LTADVLSDALEATLRAVDVLEALGVPYLVGGSLASSLHGIPRATQDVDVVAALEEAHVEPFVAALGADFYVDADMIRDALRRCASFNVIYLRTMFKVDVFVARKSRPALDEMARRQRVRIADDPPRDLVVASAEDTVAQKLAWYRTGGEISERQWKDVQGVLRVKARALDVAIMRGAAEALGVGDLLDRALDEARLSGER